MARIGESSDDRRNRELAEAADKKAAKDAKAQDNAKRGEKFYDFGWPSEFFRANQIKSNLTHQHFTPNKTH